MRRQGRASLSGIVAAGVIVAGVVLFGVGLACFPVVNSEYPRAFLYGGAGALPIAACVMIALRGLRGSEGRPMPTVELIGLLFGLAVVSFFAAGGAVLIVNAIFDDAPPAAHSVQVTRVHISYSDDSTHIVVASWRRPGEGELISAGPGWDWRFLETLRVGQTIYVDTQPGFLGLERLVGVRAGR